MRFIHITGKRIVGGLDDRRSFSETGTAVEFHLRSGRVTARQKIARRWTSLRAGHDGHPGGIAVRWRLLREEHRPADAIGNVLDPNSAVAEEHAIGQLWN